MTKLILIISFVSFYINLYSQKTEDPQVFDLIYKEALSSDVAYENLRYLTKNIGGRIAGSKQANEAAFWTKKIMEKMNLDNVFMQEMDVKQWERGDKEEGIIVSEMYGNKDVNVCALGLAIGTGSKGIEAEIVEVKSFEELRELGSKNISGKIVFFNKELDPKLFDTFRAYGGAAFQRSSGPAEAAKYGAIGVVVRSLTSSIDEFPHTGVTRYIEGVNPIPAIAICTKHANVLSKWLKTDKGLKFYFKTTSKNLPETKSYNVIGEIKGCEKPEEIIVVGGHLDAWDNSEGAHDDGAGCMQAIEVLRIFKELGIKPKRTIRAVMFMDEEIAQRGGKKYADEVRRKNEKHIAAIEADRGACAPVGFFIDANEQIVNKISSWKKYFKPYRILFFEKGGSGVDVGPLKEFGTTLIGFLPEVQRYFDWHHSANDTFEQIHIRELQLGSATIAALVYLIDKYGL